MIEKNQAIWIHYKVWDSANNVFLAGDVANHTLWVINDGVIAPATNTPQEISAGLYRILLTAAEVNGLFITLAGTSSTADVYIIATHMLTNGTTKGVELIIQYTAWDMSANAPKTGDAGNHTLIVAQANVSAGAVNAPSEVHAANVPGIISLLLDDTETIGVLDSIFGTSSTPDIVIMPTIFPVALAEDLPDVTDVRLAVDYDNGNLTGSAAIPNPDDVRLGVAVDDTTGTAAIPGANDVRLGVAVDDTTGNYVPADPSKHALGDQYGSKGIEFTGTKALTSFQLPQEIILEESEVLIYEGAS